MRALSLCVLSARPYVSNTYWTDYTVHICVRARVLDRNFARNVTHYGFYCCCCCLIWNCTAFLRPVYTYIGYTLHCVTCCILFLSLFVSITFWLLHRLVFWLLVRLLFFFVLSFVFFSRFCLGCIRCDHFSLLHICLHILFTVPKYRLIISMFCSCSPIDYCNASQHVDSINVLACICVAG